MPLPLSNPSYPNRVGGSAWGSHQSNKSTVKWRTIEHHKTDEDGKRRGVAREKIRNGTHLSDIIKDLTLYFYHPTLLIIIFSGVISLVSWR